MKLALNRIVAFLAGALLVFAVMSLTVVRNTNNENEELTEALDASMYEAGRLLADANAQFASGNHDAAKVTLATLFDKRPGSAEATEGRQLLATMETIEAESDARWEAVQARIQEEWEAALEAEMLVQSDADRLALEAGMSAALEKAWEEAQAEVRKDWELQAP
jgi:hypothetical protein